MTDRLIQQNNKAIMQVYEFNVATAIETYYVAELMRMYQSLTEKSTQ